MVVISGLYVVFGDKRLGRGALARMVIFVALDAAFAVVEVIVGWSVFISPGARGHGTRETELLMC